MIGLDLWIPYSTWISSGKQWTTVAVGKQLMGQQAGGLASVCLPPSVGTPAAPPLKLILSDSSTVAFGINCTIQIHDSLFNSLWWESNESESAAGPKLKRTTCGSMQGWKLKQPVGIRFLLLALAFSKHGSSANTLWIVSRGQQAQLSQVQGFIQRANQIYLKRLKG